MLTSIVLMKVLPPLIGLLLGGLIVWLASTSERFAGPARLKPVGDRTTFDRVAIKADDLIDAQIAALDRDQFSAFLTNLVMQHLSVVKQAPSPEIAAERMLGMAQEAFPRRNPDLASRLRVTAQSMQDRLTDTVQMVNLELLD